MRCPECGVRVVDERVCPACHTRLDDSEGSWGPEAIDAWRSRDGRERHPGHERFVQLNGVLAGLLGGGAIAGAILGVTATTVGLLLVGGALAEGLVFAVIAIATGSDSRGALRIGTSVHGALAFVTLFVIVLAILAAEREPAGFIVATLLGAQFAALAFGVYWGVAALRDATYS